MNRDKQKVILFPIHPTSWPTMYQIALRMQEGSRYEPVMLLTEGIASRKSICDEHEIEAYLFDSNILTVLNSSDSKNEEKQAGSIQKKPSAFSIKAILFKLARGTYRIFVDILKWLGSVTNQRISSFSLYQILRAVAEATYLKTYQKIVHHLLDHVNPVAAYIYSDMSAGSFSCFAQECKNRGIKLIIPAAAFQHRDITADRRMQLPYLRLHGRGAPLINRYIKKHMPEQFYAYKDQEILFYWPYEILALDFFDLLPPCPWERGKNRSDVICVEDHYQKQLMTESGVDPDRIAVTGHIEYDRLYELQHKYTKEEFNQRYNLAQDKLNIVFAIPQLYHEKYIKTWEGYLKEVEFLVESTTQTGHNVIVAFHPKVDKTQFMYLEEKFPCIVNKGRTSDVIPFCDVLISGGSSTNFWAIQCGGIVVDIVTFYGHNIDLFSYLSSVIRLTKREELAPALSRLTSDHDYLMERKRLVIKDRERYATPLDGRVGERCIALIDGSVEQLKKREFTNV